MAFTGSTEVGKLILQASAGNLKRVLARARAASRPTSCSPTPTSSRRSPPRCSASRMLSGQVCCAGTRVFVQQDFHDRFVDALTRYTSNVKAGDPLDPKTTVGPLVSKEQFDRVKGYLEHRQEGRREAVARR